MVKLQVNIIIEILGRPPANVKEALNTIVVKMGSDKGVKVLGKEYHEPRKVDDPNAKDLYTAFAEVSLELDSIANFFGIIFAYMPSHIELVFPEKIELNNFDLNELAHALTQRLHNYDAITKNAMVERDIYLNKLREIAPQLFAQQTQPPPKTKEDKSKKIKKTKPNKKKKK